MKQYIDWLKMHPVKCTLLYLVTFGSTAIITYLGANNSILIFWMLLIASIHAIIIYIDTKRIVAFAIASMMALNSMAQEAPPADPPVAENPGIIIGVLVVVGGGAAAIWAAKFCAKRFAKPGNTNKFDKQFDDEEDQEPLGESYAAAWTPMSLTGPCIQEPTTHSADTNVIAIEAVVSLANGQPQCRIESIHQTSANENTSTDLVGFQSEVEQLGLNWNPNSMSFSRNSTPTESNQVPIAFSMEGTSPMVILGDANYRFAVERSSDLAIWEPLITVKTSANQRFRIMDASESGKTFYRMRRMP